MSHANPSPTEPSSVEPSGIEPSGIERPAPAGSASARPGLAPHPGVPAGGGDRDAAGPDRDGRRVWLITGCSAGFGRAIAEAALAAGDTVVATARRPDALDLAPGNGTLHRLALDVTDPDAIDQAVETALDRCGHIDVLVNNAGHGSVGAVEELSMTELRDLFEVMFFGAVALTKAVLPHMRERGTGTVVQITSMGGQLAMPGFGAYCATKFALEGLSEALVDEVAPFGVRVVIVEPGAFRTEFGGNRMHRSRRMPAYQASTGATRDAVDQMDDTQPGDPAKAASAILRVLATDDPPLRLALGRDAVEAIRQKHTRLRDDLDRWEGLSLATDLDTLQPI